MSAMRYRLGQAVVIALLSALITACAVFAPLYDRAMQQAATAITLHNAPSVERDLQLFGPQAEFLQDRTDPSGLAAQLPTSSLFEAPVAGRNAVTDLDLRPGSEAVPRGDLWWREGQCDHVTVTAGSCPDGPREILISDNEAETYDFGVGDTMRAPAAKPPVDYETYQQPPTPWVTYKVVGTYRADDKTWWQGLRLDGLAGLAGGDVVQHDVWLTDESTFGGTTPFLDSERAWVGSRLRVDAVDVDELAAVRSDLHDLQRRADKDAEESEVSADSITSLVTSLPQLTDEVDAQIEQSRTTVPLLLVQLGVLGVIVLWLMLLAATDQRRPEVVVARLRGRGAPGARSMLLGELLPAVLAGIIPGAAVAVLASVLARQTLPGDPPFELPLTTLIAGVVAVAALILVTYAAVHRVAREPLGTLLHRTQRRRAGWTLGVGDAVAIAACGACVLAFVTGSLTGPIALAAPALLSALVGLVLAHLFAPTAMRIGRTLLRRGHLRVGVSLLDASRSIATRRTVALATVASALAVFSVCALLVGERNRAVAAEQVAGAPLIAEIQGPQTPVDNLQIIHRVLAKIDPDSTRVTSVVHAAAPSGGPTTLAVEPEQFRRIALFDTGHQPTPAQWKALEDGKAREPIAVITTGTLFEDEVTIVGLDGIEQDGKEVGSVDRIPGGGPDVALVDLATSQEVAPPDPDSSITLWFAEDDRALLRQVDDALEAEGIVVTGTQTLSDVRRGLDESVAAWSLRLGVVVGLAAVAIAVLALSVLTVTGWRTRARDLASLWLAGVDRRTVSRIPASTQLLPVVLGVVAGTGAGVLGAQLTLPDIPLFAVPPVVDTIELSVPWPAVGLTMLGCLLVLGIAAVLLGRAVASTARLDRVRETA